MGSEASMSQESGFRSGFLTLVGRPNAGKSSLVNAMLGKKAAITSDTVQTTRSRLQAVVTRPGFQLVIVDTPGLHKPRDPLGERLNAAAYQALEGVDVVAVLVDASKPVGAGDARIAELVKPTSAKKLAVVSKADLVDAETLEKQMENMAGLAAWDKVLSLSSLTGEGVDRFLENAVSYLPPGPQWFPEGMDTDQPLEMMVAEFIREKVLKAFFDEVPHAVGVVCEELAYDKKKDRYSISAVIYVERESQKGMVVGKGGSSIKNIGVQAREDLEALLGCGVFLDLRVKVKKNWRHDPNQIRRFGYGEDSRAL